MFDRFEKLLAIKGLKPADIAKSKNITPSTFTDWKTGRSVPKGDKLQKIADALDVTVDFLTGIKDKITCKECGFFYNPIDEISCKAHDLQHENYQKALKKYGFFYDADYAYENEIKDISALTDPSVWYYNDELDINIPFDAYTDYMKIRFSELLQRNNYILKYESFDEFAREKIASDIHEPFMTKDMVDMLQEKYGFDKKYVAGNDLLIARTSGNEKLMRILSYAEQINKANPEALKTIEIQLKALAEQKEKE